MATWLITGANRGLGLEFVKQLAGRGEKVYAACRTPGKMPAVQGDVHVVELDTGDAESIAALPEQLDTINVLVNNAAIDGERDFNAFDFDNMVDVFRVNVAGPTLLMRTLQSKLAQGAKLANITSGLGSIEKAGDHSPLPYSVSKAALNMTGKICSRSLDDVIVLLIHPGWVQTDMGGPTATLTPTESITNVLKVIDNATAADNGTFLNHTGEPLPW